LTTTHMIPRYRPVYCFLVLRSHRDAVPIIKDGIQPDVI
jgi:hypothetical protein